MKALLRGFVAGFGFALGASVAGTLIGYAIGRIGEASVKRLLSPEPTSSPSPSSSPTSSEPQAEFDQIADWLDKSREINDRILHCEECAYITMDPDLLAHHRADAHKTPSMNLTEALLYRPDDHPYVRKEFVGHCMYKIAPGTICGWDEAAHHKSRYGVPAISEKTHPMCPCGSSWEECRQTAITPACTANSKRISDELHRRRAARKEENND